MKANSIELLKDAYGGTFEENVKTVLNKHFDSKNAEKLWNQIVEKYSELFQKQNITEEDEDAVYYILPSVAVYRVLQNYWAACSDDKECTDVRHIDALSIFREIYFLDGQRGHDYLVNRFCEDEAFLKGFPQDFLRTVGEGKCEVICDTPEYTEFHVKSCRFIALTKELNCPKICSVFCDIDNLMYTNMHPKLSYNRDKTLYAGDDCCNFSMRYVEKE
ncbi:MAG: L-2-amino-thiazoline-4-carboxylic acid hydrolase [Treponema sp.]|nr:L-2-amino-thiazoline-4-carboxylic acid hydrolase [Treponema sp.]